MTPINDQPFYLRTESPGIDVLQGSRSNLTRAALLTEDNDTQPAYILYEIISTPSNGVLINSDTPKEAVISFTQADIDDGKISFMHDGSPHSGAFYFKVNLTA